MRRLVLAVTVAAFASPAAAQDAPVGSYQCHTVNNPVPVGTFTVTGPTTYEWVATKTTDFAPADDPSNGPGTFRMEGTFLILESGAFQAEWGNPSAEVFPRTETVVDLWFADLGGGILNCQQR